MITFLSIGAIFALVPVWVGIRAFVLPTGFEYTILGYTFLAAAAYCDLLGFLWELTA